MNWLQHLVQALLNNTDTKVPFGQCARKHRNVTGAVCLVPLNKVTHCVAGFPVMHVARGQREPDQNKASLAGCKAAPYDGAILPSRIREWRLNKLLKRFSAFLLAPRLSSPAIFPKRLLGGLRLKRRIICFSPSFMWKHCIFSKQQQVLSQWTHLIKSLCKGCNSFKKLTSRRLCVSSYQKVMTQSYVCLKRWWNRGIFNASSSAVLSSLTLLFQN